MLAGSDLLVGREKANGVTRQGKSEGKRHNGSGHYEHFVSSHLVLMSLLLLLLLLLAESQVMHRIHLPESVS